MKKYYVRVNGIPYEVEIEEIGAGRMASPQAVPFRSAGTGEMTTSSEYKAAKQEEAAGDSVRVNSPMPGTVLKINVQHGSRVTKGQVLLILEAMKMENEIAAPANGVIAGIAVKKGAQVNAGDLLLTIDNK